MKLILYDLGYQLVPVNGDIAGLNTFTEWKLAEISRKTADITKMLSEKKIR